MARSSAAIRAQVMSSRRAGPPPTKATRRSIVHGSTARPSRAVGTAKVAVGATTRKSHAIASCKPAPIAWPFTAATTGIGADVIEHNMSNNAARNSPPETSPKSAPAENARPSPVITKLRSPRSILARTPFAMPVACSAFKAFARSSRSIVSTEKPSFASTRIMEHLPEPSSS